MSESDGGQLPPEAVIEKPTRRLSDKVGVVFVGTAAGFVVHLAWGMLLVRLLDKDGVGTYRQVWLVYGMAAVIFQLGIPASISYFVPQLPSRQGMGVVLQVFGTMLALGALMGVGLFFGAAPLANRLSNPALTPLFKIFAPYPLFFLPLAPMPSLLIVRNRHGSAALLQFLYAAQAPLVAGTLLVIGLPLTAVFAGITASVGVIFAGTVVWLLRLVRRAGIEWRRQLWARQVRYSLPIGLASAVDTVGRRLDQVVIGLFYPPARFAIYTVGAFEVPIFALLSSALGAVLTPEFVRWHKAGDIRRLLQVWHQATVKMGLLIFPTVAGLLVAAPDLITLLYTQEYQESTTLFRIYLMVLLVRVTQYSVILRATGRTGVIFWATVGFLASKLVLAIAFIKLMGFIGPAVASVLGYYIYVWLLLRQISRTLQVPMSAVMPWRQLARIAGVACLAVVPAITLLYLPLGGAARLAVFCLGYAVAYGGLALWLRVLSRDDLALFCRWATLRPVVK